jgi:hypothetical protein
MPTSTTLDEPEERIARAARPRARFTHRDVDPGDAALLARLRAWASAARTLAAVEAEATLQLEDDLRILEELERVLTGDEDGEGTSDARRVVAAVAEGSVQGICSWFACPRGAFVELLAVAPWNLLRRGGAPDPRAVPGAGRALVAEVSRRSRALGSGGRVALQAENPRARAAYERMGFARMRPSDVPLALVPPGAHGWSESLRRLARGRVALADARQPWMLLDPAPALAQVEVLHRAA